MLTFNEPNSSLEFPVLRYGGAILLVTTATAGLVLMQSHWGVAAHCALFLGAVILSTWLGGAKQGLLAAVLSFFCFNYLLLHEGDVSAAEPVHLFRLILFAVVAGYVVWVTATERRAVESLRQAHIDLQVKNAALRAENLKRKQTEADLRVSEARFRALSQSAPSAIFVFESDRIIYANPGASVITQFASEELGAMSFWDITHPDYRESVKECAPAQQLGEAAARRYELKILTKHGEVRWLDFTQAAFEFGHTLAVVAIACDISEQKHAREALRDSQQLLQQVLATLPIAVAVTDRAGDILLVNEASNEIWGRGMIVSGRERWAASQGYWHHSGKRIAPTEWASARALSAGQISLNELIDFNMPDGRRRTIQNSTAPIRSAEGAIVGAVIVNEDVTARMRADRVLHDSAKRLQTLSRRLLEVQEHERRYLSRELHDEFGQILGTIMVHLQAAKGVAGAALQSRLEECISLLQSAGAKVRSLALNLRPRMLETEGLEGTLRWLAEQHQQHTGIPTQFSGHLGEVSADLAIACFRVVQEALTNVARHARARHVWISATQNHGRVDLFIRDDGLGFDVEGTLEQTTGSGHLGLLGMKDRVDILGGEFQVESRPGHGTRIRVSIPLAQPGAQPRLHSA
jgi:two-component system sensor histidine kinase UhpB